MSHIVEGHTVHAYDGELSVMHLLLVEMAGLVIDQLQQALNSFDTHQPTEQIERVIVREQQVDDFEVNIDAEIYSLLARRNPVAKDLRVVLACSKVVSDLERIGDEALNVAKVAKDIHGIAGIGSLDTSMRKTIGSNGAMALGSLRGAVEVLDSFDPELARRIIEADRELDAGFRRVIRQMIIGVDSSSVSDAIHTVQVIKALERIGNHAKSIAENIIFLTSGEDVRHHN